MAIDLPHLMYQPLDRVITKVIEHLTIRQDVSRRLESEQDRSGLEKFDYIRQGLAVLHDRAAAMASHLSIMLALCVFLLPKIESPEAKFIHTVVVLDTLVYIVLLLLTVWSLKALSLDQDFKEDEDFMVGLFDEFVDRHCIMQLVNSLTMFATIVLVFVMIWNTFAN